jgi:hypothetical protein
VCVEFALVLKHTHAGRCWRMEGPDSFLSGHSKHMAKKKKKKKKKKKNARKADA